MLLNWVLPDAPALRTGSSRASWPRRKPQVRIWAAHPPRRPRIHRQTPSALLTRGAAVPSGCRVKPVPPDPAWWKTSEGEDVVACLVQVRGDLGKLPLQRGDDLAYWVRTKGTGSRPGTPKPKEGTAASATPDHLYHRADTGKADFGTPVSRLRS